MLYDIRSRTKKMPKYVVHTADQGHNSFTTTTLSPLRASLTEPSQEEQSLLSSPIFKYQLYKGKDLTLG
jgi:hypothetical protein